MAVETAMEGREPFQWRHKRKKKKEELRECNIGFALKENLSGALDHGLRSEKY